MPDMEKIMKYCKIKCNKNLPDNKISAHVIRQPVSFLASHLLLASASFDPHLCFPLTPALLLLGAPSALIGAGRRIVSDTVGFRSGNFILSSLWDP